jgi:hypothetical protein
VAIRKSAAEEVQRLVADVCAEDGLRREAALARLAVIGIRAIPPLLKLALDQPRLDVRLAALRALEGLDDPRVFELAIRLSDTGPPELGVAAIAVLRSLLESSRGPDALDRITAIALDPARDETRRLAAVDALSEMPQRLTSPVWKRLAKDPHAALRQRAAHGGRPAPTRDPQAALAAAVEEGLPDASSAKALLLETAEAAPLTTLHKLIEGVKARETAARTAAERSAWRVIRGTAHLALARRGSRVALYDLRESLEQSETALPVEFLAAIELAGDASCVEPLASALARAGTLHTPETDWWRQHLLAAFQAVVRRERLTRRHAVLRRVAARWPDAAGQLLGRDSHTQ